MRWLKLSVVRSCAARLAAPVLVALSAAPAAATAPKIDAEACKEMRLEQTRFIETGILADFARGPDWAKANLAPDKLRQIELFIMLDEQLKFGCRDAKITLGEPKGEEPADGDAAAPNSADAPGKPVKKPKPADAGVQPGAGEKAKRKAPKPQASQPKIEDFTLLP